MIDIIDIIIIAIDYFHYDYFHYYYFITITPLLIFSFADSINDRHISTFHIIY
jgi:hypothetical protein